VATSTVITAERADRAPKQNYISLSFEKNRVIWINIEQVRAVQSCSTTPVIHQYIGRTKNNFSAN